MSINVVSEFAPRKSVVSRVLATSASALAGVRGLLGRPVLRADPDLSENSVSLPADDVLLSIPAPLPGEALAAAAGTPEQALCVCGHKNEAHQHFRRGTDCSLCPVGTCKKFRPIRA
jgi:hypothetical protein